MALFRKDATLKKPSPPDKKFGAASSAPTKALAQARVAVGPHAHLGRFIQVRGDVTGAEDLYITGHVEGSVSLPEHLVVVAEEGNVTADVAAKNVLLAGKIVGNIKASECVEVEDTGVVEGDLSAPRLIVHEGARLQSKVLVTGVERDAGDGDDADAHENSAGDDDEHSGDTLVAHDDDERDANPS